MADTNQNCKWERPPAKSKSLITINNGFSALQDDVDDKRDNSSLKSDNGSRMKSGNGSRMKIDNGSRMKISDNGSFSIQMENIKLKQKVQYLESKVDQRKVNRPNSSEIMKRDSGGKNRYSSHGNIKIADEDRQIHMKEISEDHQVKDEVVIVGDSMIKNIDLRGLSRKNYSGDTSKDIVDFVKPAARRKVKGIILHSGTKDLKQNESKSIVEQILGIGHVIHAISPKTKVCFSGVIKRSDDNELNAKVGEVNRLLKIACSAFGFDYIDNSSIDVSCLDRSGLHLNRRGDTS